MVSLNQMSGSKHAVRFRASQHQLAYKKMPQKSKRRKKTRQSWSLFLGSTLLMMGGIVVLLRTRFVERKVAKAPITLAETCKPPSFAKRRYYARPNSAKFAMAMEQLGWEPAKDWKKAEVIWHHQKSHIVWDSLKCWQQCRNQVSILHDLIFIF